MKTPLSEVATVMQNHTVCIPKEIRQEMGIQPKDVVLFVYDGERLILKKPPTLESLAGMGKAAFKKLGGGAAFLKRERASWGN